MPAMSFLLFDPKLYLNFLQESKKDIENQLASSQKELQQIDEQITSLQAYFSPKVIITVSKTPSGTDRYIGRFKATYPDGSSKMVAINLGPISRFEGKNDPKLLELAKIKATERFGRIYPNFWSDSLKASNNDTL